uniref:dolichyl-phosphate-mannose--protein mannosyltransferase n=1 Tax=Angiostrongylus cantonensis TaxID=6313 RepID=A0A0K0DAK2_ANGCA
MATKDIGCRRVFQLASYCYQWLVNVRLLVFPHSLCFDYSMGCVPAVESWNDNRALSLPLILLMAVCVIVFLYELNDRLLYFGVVLAVVTFLPASNLIVTVGFTVAERVLYLPSAGVCICGALLFERSQRLFRNTDKVFVALLIIALTKTYQRSEEWGTELDLYTSGLRVCPKNAKVHYNLGKVLSEIGDVDGAEQKYWNAIRLNPQYEHAMNNLANILEAKGRRKEAELLLRKAEALQSFHQSLRLRPLSADCLFNIGNLYQKMGQPQKALESWMNATRINPNHIHALTNVFVLLDELEQCNLVVEISRKLPDTFINQEAALAFQIGVCLGKMKRFREAEDRLKVAVRINPHNSMYYANLGVLYQRRARYDLAEDMYLQALSINSHTSSVRLNLRAVQEKLNRSRTFMKQDLLS